MSGWVKGLIVGLVGAAVIVVAAGVIVVYTGAYNVAATEPHWGVTQWALNTLQHTSVAARAGDVEGVPPTDSAALAHGFEHYHAMCVQCHGAPGIDRGEAGQGIRPEPPRLEEEAHEWTDAELFWITKHGIRLAGMPAFGATHSDEELWGLVGFMRQLEDMTEDEYAERVRALQASRETGEEEEQGHTHPPGTPAH